MKRFFDNDPDDQNFLSENEEDEPQLQAEFTAFINPEDFMNVMSMDIAQTQLNQQLLVVAADLARKSDWLWIFRSTAHQEEKIERMYFKLIEISGKIPEHLQEPPEEGENPDADV